MVLHPGSTSTEGPAGGPPAQPEAGGPVVTGKEELGDRDAGLGAVRLLPGLASGGVLESPWAGGANRT